MTVDDLRIILFMCLDVSLTTDGTTPEVTRHEQGVLSYCWTGTGPRSGTRGSVVLSGPHVSLRRPVPTSFQCTGKWYVGRVRLGFLVYSLLRVLYESETSFYRSFFT